MVGTSASGSGKLARLKDIYGRITEGVEWVRLITAGNQVHTWRYGSVCHLTTDEFLSLPFTEGEKGENLLRRLFSVPDNRPLWLLESQPVRILLEVKLTSKPKVVKVEFKFHPHYPESSQVSFSDRHSIDFFAERYNDFSYKLFFGALVSRLPDLSLSGRRRENLKKLVSDNINSIRLHSIRITVPCDYFKVSEITKEKLQAIFKMKPEEMVDLISAQSLRIDPSAFTYVSQGRYKIEIRFIIEVGVNRKRLYLFEKEGHLFETHRQHPLFSKNIFEGTKLEHVIPCLNFEEVFDLFCHKLEGDSFLIEDEKLYSNG